MDGDGNVPRRIVPIAVSSVAQISAPTLPLSSGRFHHPWFGPRLAHTLKTAPEMVQRHRRSLTLGILAPFLLLSSF